MRPMTVAPSRIAGGGSVRPTLTSNVRVTGLACGATSRTRPLRRDRRIVGQADGDLRDRSAPTRINCAGTSKTASRPSLRASRTIICPACTTSPAPGPIAVTTPGASALSSVKPTRSCAVFSCASAASTCDCAVCSACFGLIVDSRASSSPAPAASPAARSDCAPGSTGACAAARVGLAPCRSAFSLVLRFEPRDHLTGLDAIADLERRSRSSGRRCGMPSATSSSASMRPESAIGVPTSAT